VKDEQKRGPDAVERLRQGDRDGNLRKEANRDQDTSIDRWFRNDKRDNM
jgi:hypothetical protein